MHGLLVPSSQLVTDDTIFLDKKNRVVLTNALRTLVRIQLKKIFKGKEKKNVLTVFFIPKVITLIAVKILIAIKVIKTFLLCHF